MEKIYVLQIIRTLFEVMLLALQFLLALCNYTFWQNHRGIIGDKLADCNVSPLLIEYTNILSSRGKGFPVKDEDEE